MREGAAISPWPPRLALSRLTCVRTEGRTVQQDPHSLPEASCRKTLGDVSEPAAATPKTAGAARGFK